MFEIGDTVFVKDIPDGYPFRLRGEIGTVCTPARSGYGIGVRFSKVFSGGHNCGGSCPSGYGYYLPDYVLSKMIVVVRFG